MSSLPTLATFNEPPTAPAEPCSQNFCTACGNTWPPTFGLGKCSGCGMPVVVVKMEQCPRCNEPVTKIRMRTDHIPSGHAIGNICRGGGSLGEVNFVEMTRTHAKTEESSHKIKEVVSKI